MKQHGFLISAPQSGSGKTTVSLAIMAALTRRGLNVVPFKCGPDFIDPGYHKAITGKASINLDGWICSEEFVLDTFKRRLTQNSTAIIEGAMGLFDGVGSLWREGSSAQIAAIIGAPVLLVVNVRGMAASAAALVQGFANFDPNVKIAGVIFNNVGSSSHAAMLTEAVSSYSPEIICFGSILRDESLSIPSRHLGLVTADDNPLSDQFVNNLADMAERSLDINGLAQLLFDTTKQTSSSQTEEYITENRIRIAVARDAAFCFIYDDNLRLLEKAGAELLFFSPLHDAAPPPRISGIYLPGGYPELYAEQLASNTAMMGAIRVAADANIPIYAECGGFVYLTEGLTASDNDTGYDFVGIFPVQCKMLSRRKALGYREVKLTKECIIGKTGDIMRGHEFHYSEIGVMPKNIERCYQVSRRGVTLGDEGYKIRNTLGSYIHLHFGSNPEIARNFISKRE